MMSAFSPGLSDSLAAVLDAPLTCPHCESSSQIAGGLCVGCLLGAGLNASDDDESETLTDVLAEVRLPDQNWRLGNYEILEEIGRGGMGVIYRARQRHSRRIVAVKRVLSYHADSRETLARFRREAQAAASLDHPNILPIYEVSESEDGLPFFSMKFAPGGTLQQVAPALRKEPRQCVALVAKVVRAVQYAHSRGILHRDLKPGNILLDGRGEPLVSDFGLAKWLDTASDLTRTLTIFGTPGYIAPEQASSAAAELKPTADVYSLGAILFDLLAGRPPFLGAHALSVIRQAAESPAPKLRTLSKLADRDLETICSRCLEREPAARYQNAHDLAEDLERWLEGRSIVARPTHFPMRIYRWSRRNPKLAGSVAGLVILIGIGVVQKIGTDKLASIVRETETAQRSIVLTPFEDLDSLSATSPAAQAAEATFTGALQRIQRLYVRSIPSADKVAPFGTADWKRIGETSGARVILNGSVRQREGRQHITLRLIDGTRGTIIRTWFRDSDQSGPSVDTSLAPLLEFLNGPKRAQITESGGADPADETARVTARSYCDRGKEFMFRYNLADLDRAIDSFRKAIELDPNCAEAQALLASACQARAQTDAAAASLLLEADAALKRALQIAPMLPEVHRAKAGILRRRGELRKSLDPFLTAYELDPTDERTLALLGDVYDQVGRPDVALKWFEKALHLQIRPFFADNLGNAWTSLVEDDEAEKAYQTAIVFRPDLPVGLLGLSRLALFRGDFETAREKCRQAAARFNSDPAPKIMTALIEFFDHNYARAETLYEEAIALERSGGVDFAFSVRYLSALGFIKNALNRQTEGRALIEEALSLDERELAAVPDNLRRLYSAAANHAALGHRNEANAFLEKAVAAGWIDYRAMQVDPRFDSIRATSSFQNIIARLTTQVEEMRRQRPGRKLASNLY